MVNHISFLDGLLFEVYIHAHGKKKNHCLQDTHANDASMNGYPAILRMSLVSVQSARVLIGTSQDGLKKLRKKAIVFTSPIP